MAATARGPKSASARPGPCTRPRSADALTRREYHPARQPPASRSFLLGRRRRPAGTARARAGGLRGLHLDPGSGRMVPRTRVGRSALRAAAPAGHRPRRGRDPAPGRVRPMPSPGGEYHPARQTPASRSYLLAAGAHGGDGRAADWRLRGLHLDPGSGRMVPMTRVGRSALRAAAPAGRGRSRAVRPSRGYGERQSAIQAKQHSLLAGISTGTQEDIGCLGVEVAGGELVTCTRHNGGVGGTYTYRPPTAVTVAVQALSVARNRPGWKSRWSLPGWRWSAEVLR